MGPGSDRICVILQYLAIGEPIRNCVHNRRVFAADELPGIMEQYLHKLLTPIHKKLVKFLDRPMSRCTEKSVAEPIA
jgi:hypothetical protein